MTASARVEQPKSPLIKSPWIKALPLVVLATAMLAVFLTGAYRFIGFDALLAQRETFRAFVSTHRVESLGLFAAIYAVCVALSVPGASALTILGGFLFGWLVGGLVAVIAATFGAIAVFLAARTALGEALSRKAGPRLRSLAEGFRKDAVSYLLFLRLVPLFPFWLVNLAPALFNVSFATFAVTTLVGIVPGTFAFAFAGSGIDSVIQAQQASRQACLARGQGECGMELSLSNLITPELIAAFVALGILSLVPVLAKKLFKGRFQGIDDPKRTS